MPIGGDFNVDLQRFGLLALQGVSELIKRVAALRGAVALDTTYIKLEQ